MQLYDVVWINTILCSVLAAFLFAWKPSNIGSILSLLSVCFGLVPGILFTYYGMRDFYSFRAVIAAGGYIFDTKAAEQALVYISGINLCFALGTTAAFLYRPKSAFKVSWVPDGMSYRWVVRALILLWLSVFAIHVRTRGVSLGEVFVPAVRTGSHADQSGYLYTTLMTVPIVLMILEAASERRSARRIILFGTMALITCFTTHQRREIVTVLLAITGVMAFLPSRTNLKSAFFDVRKTLSRQRRLVLIGLSIGLCAVPLAWYLRVFSTNMLEGRDVNAFELRGFLELLMGSPATGFSTFTLLIDYVSRVGADPFLFPSQVLSLPVPRALWPGKPGDFDLILQSTYSMPENPSLFWFGEMYVNYGIMSLLAALLIGYGISRWHLVFSHSSSLIKRSIAVLIFAYSITLFKNGFYTVSTRFGVAVVILFIAFYFSSHTVSLKWRPAIAVR